MAGWCNYIYCSECDRPFLKTKRRIVTFRTTDNKSSAFSHCLYCGLSFGSLSPTFWRNVSLPALGVSSVAFANATDDTPRAGNETFRQNVGDSDPNERPQ